MQVEESSLRVILGKPTWHEVELEKVVEEMGKAIGNATSKKEAFKVKFKEKVMLYQN